jgi:hypothetical protein
MNKSQKILAAFASNTLLCVTLVWQPLSARAEAPTPASRNGCWSREIVMRPQPEARATTTIKGRIVSIDQSRSQWLAPKQVATWVRLVTPSGEQKSVYLGSKQLLQQQNISLKVRDNVEVQGFPMPRAKKPTLVATSLSEGNRTWKIDNFTDLQREAKSCKYTG